MFGVTSVKGPPDKPTGAEGNPVGVKGVNYYSVPSAPAADNVTDYGGANAPPGDEKTGGSGNGTVAPAV